MSGLTDGQANGTYRFLLISMCIIASCCLPGTLSFLLGYASINVGLLYSYSPSQWPRGVRHELSLLARTLGSWVRIPLEAWMSACVYSVC
jgi:hypothetical protein